MLSKLSGPLYQASKLLQEKPVTLQFVSDGEALHTIS